MATTATDRTGDVIDELRGWLADQWDPDLTVGEWWERLGLAGWAAPALPANAFGRGLSRAETVRVQQEIAAHGALGAPGGLGLLLAAPTIATHGTQEQIDRYVRAIVTGQEAWCQLFSEPGAGSDLAGLGTRAERDGEEWRITGQKVWTSAGHVADLGMLIARTDPDVPKHQGITYFALDMHQPGVDIRPLKEMTGRALFNEVFLSDAVAHDDQIIGGLGHGWAVANTTLAFERAGLGAGGGSEARSPATPGTVAGDLERRAGDFVRGPSVTGARRERSRSPFGTGGQVIVDLARRRGATADPIVRQDLARLYSYNEIARFTNLRHRAVRAAGGDIPGVANIAKLSMSRILRVQREVGLRVLGPAGALHAYSEADKQALDAATGEPAIGLVTEMALFSPAPSIYGGTDEIQRNIIGERALGLPKEPGPDKATPWRDLPKNG